MSAAPILVVLADGIGYHGALVATAGPEPRVLAEAGTAATGLAMAVADLARRLTNPAGRAPSRVVLLSWQVHAAVLALPVDPRRPLPPEQMRELVRWELEPFAASARARRLGAILVGRGHLRAADRDRLLATLESPLAGVAAPRRFGETAVAEGLINATQLAECLALQQDAPDPEATLACGWRPLRGRGDEGRWRWLVAGAPEPLRTAAAAACVAAGLRLLALMPAAGCARPPGDEAQAVLDHQRGLLCRVRWEDGEPADLRQSVLSGTDDPLAAALALVDADAQRVWLVGTWEEGARAGLSSLGRPCAPLPAGPFAGMAWAAQAAIDPRLPAALIPARDPRRRWWRRPARLAAAACLVLALTVLTLAAHFHWRTRALEQVLGTDRARQNDARAIDAKQAELVAAERQVTGLERDLPVRQQVPAQALAILAEVCPADVQFRRIRVVDGEGVEVSGWSASAAAAQAFRSAVQERFPNLRLTDPALALRREIGAGDISGFAFSLRLETRR